MDKFEAFLRLIYKRRQKLYYIFKTKSGQGNSQELTQSIQSKSHPRYLVGKMTAQNKTPSTTSLATATIQVVTGYSTIQHLFSPVF